MMRSTPWLRWSVLGVILAGATPATAQTVTTSDLVGSWTGNLQEDTRYSISFREMHGKYALRLRPDSIFEETVDDKTQKGYWRTSRDTLWFSFNESGRSWGWKVTLQDQRLTLSYPKQGARGVYQRADMPKQP